MSGLPHLQQQWNASRLSEADLPTLPSSVLRAASYQLQKLYVDGQVLLEGLQIIAQGPVGGGGDDEGAAGGRAAAVVEEEESPPAFRATTNAVTQQYRRKIQALMEDIKMELSVYHEFLRGFHHVVDALHD